MSPCQWMAGNAQCHSNESNVSDSPSTQKCPSPTALELGPCKKPSAFCFCFFFLPHSIYFAFRLTQDLLVHHGCSVLKSGPRTRKKPATEPDCNQFGLDCSCSPEGFEISPVAVAEAWVKLKDWLWTSCNQSSEGPVAGLGLVINYSTIPCFEHFKGVLEMHKTWVLDMHA